MSNNRDISNNLITKNIKDISNSPLTIKEIQEKIENIHKLLLEDCKRENKKIINLKKNNNNNCKNNIDFNQTIKDILKNMSNKRQINKSKYYSIITNSMDNKYLTNNIDISKNSLVKYNYKNTNRDSITKYRRDLDLNFNKLLNSTNMFRYHTTDNLFTRSRSSNIYIPPPKLRPHPPIPIKKTYVTIDVEINKLDDLIKLTEDYPLKFDTEYNINMEAIHNIKKPVIELKNMIGMKKLKDSILDQILYFIQEFHTHNKNNDFMHTVIYGPPGTGKTETAKIIGKIFSNLGILKNKTFTKATRADLIAGYLGQTALKTRDMIEKSIGGVLFIDEAYALGNSEKRDSFAKECIDTLCEGLSDNKDKLMVIIAGYENELKNCFFAYNQGLDSRFTWRFNTDDYDYKELFLIFKKKVNEIGWKLHEKIKDTWFKEKMDYFKFYGRDIETLLAKTKIAHGRRVFCLKPEEKTVITPKDLDNGFERFLDNNEVKERKNDVSKQVYKHMYM
jgi:AAA+ superfamily predicted ATPase